MARDDAMTGPEREVWVRLDEVFDPELDEPITELGFVEEVAVEGAAVRVMFRLPTYWCSPNFAFLMAEGIRREVSALPWVQHVEVRLEDHLCAEEMNEAINRGESFATVFAARLGGGDLEEVRDTFAKKAHQRRQETVIRGLRAQGLSPGEIAEMTMADLDRVAFEDREEALQLERYRRILVERAMPRGPGDHAFPDPDGVALTTAGFPDRMRVLRGVRINMEFGTSLCRGLKQARYKEHVTVDGEPTLVDFMLDRVPPRQSAG
ncbi:MAG: iron-sulfur cluster assembly protein [Pseudomonadota bacterium]